MGESRVLGAPARQLEGSVLLHPMDRGLPPQMAGTLGGLTLT